MGSISPLASLGSHRSTEIHGSCWAFGSTQSDHKIAILSCLCLYGIFVWIIFQKLPPQNLHNHSNFESFRLTKVFQLNSRSIILQFLFKALDNPSTLAGPCWSSTKYVLWDEAMKYFEKGWRRFSFTIPPLTKDYTNPRISVENTENFLNYHLLHIHPNTGVRRIKEWTIFR